jgi:hypothetical protein
MASVFSDAKFLQLLILKVHDLSLLGSRFKCGVKRAYCGFNAVIFDTPIVDLFFI